MPSRRFEHVHIDIVVMPVSEGKRYCLTCVDRFSRWPEAIPLRDQEAETVAKAFYQGWIARFGVPLRITTNRGRQFESHLFRQLNELTGTSHFTTTAYHPQANGMVERFHRQLKAAIKCHGKDRWTEILPTVLLGVRAAWKDDLQATTAELVYGETLRLPGQLLSEPAMSEADEAGFVKELRRHFGNLRPIKGTAHGESKCFIFRDLATTDQVFVRHDGPRAMLQAPYNGPYPVVRRTDKVFVVRVNGKDMTVSIDRVKPAYIFVERSPSIVTEVPTSVNRTPESDTEDSDSRQTKDAPPHQRQPVTKTRSGRSVHFPDRFQAGLK
jgi:hypothetical protein